MEKYLGLCKKCPLFQNLTDDKIIKILLLKESKVINYEKDIYLLHAGDITNEIGLILSGTLSITRLDFDGNETIISKISAFETFQEAFVISGRKKSPVSILTTTNTTVLYLDYTVIENLSTTDSTLYALISKNLLTELSKKLIFLNQKVNILEKQSIREKILTYLNPFFIKYKHQPFEIPFNREQLANFLGVNRSALSRELSNMKKDNIIDYYKNSFKML